METKTLEQTAKTLMARAEIFGCSYKTAWEYHMLKEEKQDFDMLEVFEEVQNQIETKIWKTRVSSLGFALFMSVLILFVLNEVIK